MIPPLYLDRRYPSERRTASTGRYLLSLFFRFYSPRSFGTTGRGNQFDLFLRFFLRAHTTLFFRVVCTLLKSFYAPLAILLLRCCRLGMVGWLVGWRWWWWAEIGKGGGQYLPILFNGFIIAHLWSLFSGLACFFRALLSPFPTPSLSGCARVGGWFGVKDG